jgi:hypothetical protein
VTLLSALPPPRVVVAVTSNHKFIFSGGYADHSVKCHVIATATAAATQGKGKGREGDAGGVDADTGGGGGVDHNGVGSAGGVVARGLCSVVYHTAAVTALLLASDQVHLITGAADGGVLLWRVFVQKHEWNRPPLAAEPIGSFHVHETPVVAVSCDANGTCCLLCFVAFFVSRFERSRRRQLRRQW